MATKYVFFTGGVVSGLGKGISASSLAALMEAHGYTATMLKIDPYVNVDPGTMSPFQHGEVFVTDDGAETDLDLGHYERFTSASMASILSISKSPFSRITLTASFGIMPRSAIFSQARVSISSQILNLFSGSQIAAISGRV